MKFFRQQNIEAKMVVDVTPLDLDDTMIVYDDEKLRSEGFRGVQNAWFGRVIQDPGAWGKAFYFAAENSYDYYHFIEDDVYCRDITVFAQFIEAMSSYDTDLIAGSIHTQETAPTWPHWEDDFFIKCMLCISRVSGRLMEAVLKWREEHGKFVFLERQFPGVCVEQGMSYLDFLKEPSLSDFFFKYEWRDFGHKHIREKIFSGKITHPIKNYR